MKKNVVIAQSGGPTAVINNSIRGAVDSLFKSDKIDKIYGAKMGIIGVLKEELYDINSQNPQQVKLLSKTPSAGVIGSCRYKIKSDEDMERIIDVFEKHNVGYFFYCGGNDSMDTANKVSVLAKKKGLDIISTGITKTIDNDVGGDLQEDGTFALCDHNPGYGSVARYTAMNILEANQENKASYTSDPVLVISSMGRKIGFITASARLADPTRKMPLLILLPEALNKNKPEENLQFILERVNEKIEEFGRCIVSISEGLEIGDLEILKDNFGHAQFGASGKSVDQALINYLNGLDRKDSKGFSNSRLKCKGIARCEKPGTKQRRDFFTTSQSDLKEAYEVGAYAAEIALRGEGGYMSTIIREPGNPYQVRYDKVPLDLVANADRKFPQKWISENKVDVTDEFINWALPLLGDPLPEFAEFEEIFAPKKCKDYIPVTLR
ncbi:diphosphate--fructose-6-phosphate 1-phosphotransferase [bacterium]|nr:diphosphate--fructose-6-phosphate 1-phosphotransferase [bacterium]